MSENGTWYAAYLKEINHLYLRANWNTTILRRTYTRIRFNPIDMAHVIEHKLLETGSLQSKGWYAWIEYHSHRPHGLHVVGTLEILNPGIQLKLVEKISEDPNEEVLNLRLLMRQESGEWPEMACWHQVSFSKSLLGNLYQKVHIHSDLGIMEKMPVQIVT